MKRASTFFVGFVLLLAAMPAFAGEKPLATSEIGRLLIGNTIHGIGAESGWFFAIHYRPDGVAAGLSSNVQDGQPIYFDNGRWEVTDENGYCLQWKTWKEGIRRCMDMIPKGDRFEFRTKDGRLQSIVELIAGNPNNL